ncbi:hypothetical protein T45_05536 [Streptomyces turgidiscabies]|nr:hypothetical protein T45_05536 [Streptomyces turgidiscabies]
MRSTGAGRRRCSRQPGPRRAARTPSNAHQPGRPLRGEGVPPGGRPGWVLRPRARRRWLTSSRKRHRDEREESWGQRPYRRAWPAARRSSPARSAACWARRGDGSGDSRVPVGVGVQAPLGLRLGVGGDSWPGRPRPRCRSAPGWSGLPARRTVPPIPEPNNVTAPVQQRLALVGFHSSRSLAKGRAFCFGGRVIFAAIRFSLALARPEITGRNCCSPSPPSAVTYSCSSSARQATIWSLRDAEQYADRDLSCVVPHPVDASSREAHEADRALRGMPVGPVPGRYVATHRPSRLQAVRGEPPIGATGRSRPSGQSRRRASRCPGRQHRFQMSR